MLRNWKDLFRHAASTAAGEDLLEDFPFSLASEGPAQPSHRGTGISSPQRLSLSFPKRSIFDFTHLIPPYDVDNEVSDRTRWQIKEAMRDAIAERRSADESIISFAELIVLCGFDGTEDPRRMLEPSEAIELAEKYYKRSVAWKAATDAGRPEAERINLSKDVYASENSIFRYFLNLRSAFSRLVKDGSSGELQESELLDPELPGAESAESAEKVEADASGNGTGEGAGAEAEAEAPAAENGAVHPPASEPPVRDPEQLYAHRRDRFCEFKLTNRFEEAYIAYREKVVERVERPSDDRPVERVVSGGGGGVSLDVLLQFMQAMNLAQGGGGKQQVLPADSAAAVEPAKKLARKLRTDADFTVKDKERLIQVIYSCEAQGLKFDRDFETLEAMVYRKPSQVILTLSEKIDDPVFYLS